MRNVRFIDLFAGIGGIRKGLEEALAERGLQGECVLTSEIKPYAVDVLRQNHPNEEIRGDIRLIDADSIPDFDILCAGFPCQAFSAAGKRQGFADTRGTMFFEIERILKAKMPLGFILENVPGLLNHDEGNTLKVIKQKLADLGYTVAYKVLDASAFGVPQKRERVYIVGTLNGTEPNLFFPQKPLVKLSSVLEKGLPVSKSKFVQNLLAHYSVDKLYGVSIKDKRGGKDNIHSWDLETKGPLSAEQKKLLNLMMTERRKKKWAADWGIDWMDGMPLSLKQISSFYASPDLKEMLDDLATKGYVRLEYPKKLVKGVGENGTLFSHRVYDETKPMGYNIVTGKLSFEVGKVLGPNNIAPTLVAMDMQKIFVPDEGGIRRLTLREGLRMFGYPDDYKFNISEKLGFDLLGNTVVVPVIKAVASRLIDSINLQLWAMALQANFKPPIQIQRWDEGVSDIYTPSQMNN
ncbi:MAG: DNA cytosine methyltransferase [Bacteroidales bacterium]|nr:DNA cytosine methyltransferase [Bacteroidales bacterium]